MYSQLIGKSKFSYLLVVICRAHKQYDDLTGESQALLSRRSLTYNGSMNF